MNYGYPIHTMSPQAYRRLGATLSPVEASDLADDIADALEDGSGVRGLDLTSAQRLRIYNVLRRGA